MDGNEGIPGSDSAAGGDNEGKAEMEAGGRTVKRGGKWGGMSENRKERRIIREEINHKTKGIFINRKESGYRMI